MGYFGFSGGVFQSSASRVKLADVNHAAREKHMSEAEFAATGPTLTASQQYLYKPMSWDGSKTAVLLMNSDSSKQDLTLKLADVPGMTGPCDVRDLWERKDLGNHADTVTVSVESHDAAFLMLSGCTFAPTPPPPAQSTVVNPASGKCLDIYNNEFKNEAKVQIYSCNGGDNQQWMLQDGALVNPASGMCLDIYNHDGLSPDQYKDETKVELYSCNGNPNQQWELQGGQLVNPPSGKCLDIYSPSGALENETPLQLFTCGAGKVNQGWEMQEEFLV